MTSDTHLLALLRAISDREADQISASLALRPELARAVAGEGASRQDANAYFLEGVHHHVYAGDTALHIAAAAHDADLARRLIALGADVRARNRNGAEPLHYAADGAPALPGWAPGAQAETIAGLIAAGADPDAADRRGVTPLHRAVRKRCAAAVEALLDGGASPDCRSRSGSTPLDLTAGTTGSSGSGSAEAKAQLPAIVALLARHGARS